ncbi:LOW QUALITY PROTEIN: putative ribosome-binding factor A, mitochondrial [Microcaecilia unicolor]|uniref:LOW QUALITY PROTEIN: putative ribosome-binding factor A, mitochondrial n=1 Tax=Microcaecilia unicolor TaxID=1415580 RepID=A0A6P7YX83_9AMPH|nr:LOW QUALITY PROTEIN: putative ribosome-binding factor A, mitochondrial [Microcaecilia unicolor]
MWRRVLCAAMQWQLAGGRGGQSLHCTQRVAAKSLLRKFLTKNKKKFWYESPTLGSQLKYKPSSVIGTLKALPPKRKREDSIRMRALNVILYRAVTDLLNSAEVSLELYNLQAELSKVSLAPDFSACRLYWRITGDAERDKHMEEVLQKNASRIRYLLMSRQVMGGIPPFVFVRDKEDAAILEVEKLLEIADFGPDDDDDHVHNDVSQELETSPAPLSSPQQSSLFGIDHEELNRQIAEYKKSSREKEKRMEGIGLLQQHQEQLAELRRHKILKKKRKKAKDAFLNDDITPQKYLLEKYNEEALGEGDEMASPESKLEHELQEAVELDAEDANASKPSSGERKNHVSKP